MIFLKEIIRLFAYELCLLKRSLWSSEMNTTLLKIDLVTHLKIVVVGLMGAPLFTWAALMAHWGTNGI